MKIVIATPFYPPEKGVLGTYAAGLESAFGRLGHEAVTVPIGSIRRLPSFARHAAFFLKIVMKLRGADAVLVLDTWSVGLPAFFASRVARVPLLVRIGGDFLWEAYVERTKEPVRFSDFYSHKRHFTAKERLFFYFHRMLTRGARILFFNSQFQSNIWQRVYKIGPEKARILENVFPPERAYEPPRGHVFVSAGRPIALKNYGGLERIFARIRAQYPDVELDTRLLPHDEHLARIRNSYAIIIPSVSEMASNTAIDAIANGRPFIMTDDTGTKERFGECGLFVNTHSEDAMVAAIEKLLDPHEYERITKHIRAFSFSRTWDDLAREILAAV